MNTKVKNMIYCALFACILVIMAQIKITLPGIVPITLQTLGVYIIGCVQKPKYACISALVYIALGAVGLPVFSGSGGGLGVLIGPTGGYIYSFPIMALVMSLIVKNKKGILIKLLALLAGTAVCYSIGTAWFMYVTGNTLLTALTWCVIPFLLGDAIKFVITIMVSEKIYKYIN